MLAVSQTGGGWKEDFLFDRLLFQNSALTLLNTVLKFPEVTVGQLAIQRMLCLFGIGSLCLSYGPEAGVQPRGRFKFYQNKLTYLTLETPHLKGSQLFAGGASRVNTLQKMNKERMKLYPCLWAQLKVQSTAIMLMLEVLRSWCTMPATLLSK